MFILSVFILATISKIYAAGIINMHGHDSIDFYALDRPANNILTFWSDMPGFAQRVYDDTVVPEDFLALKNSTSSAVHDFKQDPDGFREDLKASILFMQENENQVAKIIGEIKAENVTQGLLLLQKLMGKLPASFLPRALKHKGKAEITCARKRARTESMCSASGKENAKQTQTACASDSARAPGRKGTKPTRKTKRPKKGKAFAKT